MDIAHHGAIAAAGFTFLTANDQFVAGTAFLAGSVLPDLDVAFMALGKRAFLKNHQGPTHSLIASPLIAAIIAAPLGLLAGFNINIFTAALLGLWIHTLLDLTNTYGIELLWPVKKERYSFDTVFFIDSITWTLTIGFFASTYLLKFNVNIVFLIYASAFLFYVIFKFFLHRRVTRKLECDYAVPSSINPAEYYITEVAGDSVRTYLYNALIGNKKKVVDYPFVSERHQDMAQQSRVFNDIARITKLFHITEVHEEAEGTTMVARDLAVRNFGGKFGRTTLKFNSDGKLIHEVADI